MFTLSLDWRHGGAVAAVATDRRQVRSGAGQASLNPRSERWPRSTSWPGAVMPDDVLAPVSRAPGTCGASRQLGDVDRAARRGHKEKSVLEQKFGDGSTPVGG
eukprot:scaffold63779_cov64-Phaeocystis_antarctica.AAC.1